MTQAWENRSTSDLDGMVEQHAVRFLVVDNKMFYFLDGAVQRGVAFELGNRFVDDLNKKYTAYRLAEENLIRKQEVDGS